MQLILEGFTWSGSFFGGNGGCFLEERNRVVDYFEVKLLIWGFEFKLFKNFDLTQGKFPSCIRMIFSIINTRVQISVQYQIRSYIMFFNPKNRHFPSLFLKRLPFVPFCAFCAFDVFKLSKANWLQQIYQKGSSFLL